MNVEPDNNIFKSIEKSYKTFFENCLDAIFISSQDGSIYAANKAACKMLGWTEAEITRLGRDGIVEKTSELSGALSERKTTGKFFGELIFIKKDGTRFPVEISSAVFKHFDGREFSTSIARDISKRKKVEQALTESEERFRLASKASGFGAYSYEFESGKAFYSDEFLAFYGLLPGETLELDSDLIAKALLPDDKAGFLEAMTLANDPKGNGILDYEYRIIHRDGEIRWLKVRGLTVFTGTGKLLHANGIVQDITAHKKEEKELNELFERCRLITEYSGLGIAYYSIDGEILLLNEQALKNLGGRSEDFIGRNVVEVFGNEAGNIYIDRFKKAAESELSLQFEDYVELDGNPGWYLSTHKRILSSNGLIDGIHVIAENITKRKLAEIELRQNEERLSLIFSSMSEGVALNEIIYDKAGKMTDYRILEVNDAYYRIADYKKNTTIIGNTATEVYGMTSNSITAFWNKHKSSDNTEFTEYISPNNNIWYRISTSPFRGNKFVTTFTDITDRKKVENALSQSLDWQQAIFEGSIDAIFISDENSSLVAVNKSATSLTGYSKKQLLKMSIPDLHEIDDLDAYLKYHARIFKGEKILSESKIRKRDGAKVEVEFNNSLISISGKMYMHTTARDITERKRAETALRNSEARFRGLFENSIVGIAMASPDGKLNLANRALARIYGFETSESVLSEVKDIGQVYHDPEIRKELLTTLHQTGEIDSEEVEMLRKDGSRCFVMMSVREVRDADKKLLYTIGTHLDITARKEAENKILAASHYSRNLLEASLDPLVTISSEGKITDVNLATEKVTGIKRDKLIGSDFADYFIETEKAREGYNLVFSKGEVKNYPLTIRHRTGRTTEVLYNATVFKNENGDVQGVFAAARDITIRKKMEAKLRTSKRLLEKLNHHLNDIRENERTEIALNLHDDLGQRLTALGLDVAWIKSRIGVQTAAVTKKIDDMMHEINDTIDGIRELSSFLRPAILYDLGLVPAIISQLKKFENQTGIQCNFNFDSEEFNDDEKISLILYRVIQESLTNIVRHSMASAMEVNLRKLRNTIELVVSDNGIGMESDKINSISSLGLEGIRERVKSANGEVSIRSKQGSGTTIRVKIPVKKN